MAWVSGWFLLISLALGFVFYYYWRNAWLPTVIVLGGGFLVLATVFYMSLWPFLLAYVLLSWLGSWFGSFVRNRRHS